MKLLIRPRHDEEPGLIARLEALGAQKTGRHPIVSYWQLESSLDEFAVKWGEKFTVEPAAYAGLYFIYVKP